MRNAGCWLTWNQKARSFQGSLLSSRKTAEDRMSVFLFLAGPENSEGPHLYDPRVMSVLGDEMRIVGLEKHGKRPVLPPRRPWIAAAS